MTTQQSRLYANIKTKAKHAFIKRNYTQALELLSYAHVMRLDFGIQSEDSIHSKESLEIETLCALSDMAIEHEEEARALFDYYQVITQKSKQESQKDSSKQFKSAEEIILDMVQNFDQNIYTLNLALTHLEDIEVDKNDGILYKDFENLEKEIGFKEAFVDLMFSTKIIFTNKNEFLFFMQNLVKHGFKEVALHYFENIGNNLFFDKDFAKLYQKILQNP
ncbi:hypothetical protein [Helicobacter sp.]|uniref:hypothetical protein n=1 Tax=Helicobacter sp. TaxID=218 RepID=UPI002A76359F|nr:hypothetical protein [Helicobacter sp.]MDY2584936.1 hypothetical protein [Helicobacter sp.]